MVMKKALLWLRRGLPIWLAMILLIGLASVADACPTCKQALEENDPHGSQMMAGYFYSILFMMSMPFVLIGTFGGFAYLSVRRARKESDTQ